MNAGIGTKFKWNSQKDDEMVNSVKLKCHCNNCSGELEFEKTQIGTTVACPLCEMDTVLYWVEPTVGPDVGTIAQDTQEKNSVILPIVIVSGICGSIGFIWWLIADMSHETREGFGLIGLGEGFMGLAVIVIAAAVSILWLLFPVFVYFSLQKMKKEMAESNQHLLVLCNLLKRIENVTHTATTLDQSKR